MGKSLTLPNSSGSTYEYTAGNFGSVDGPKGNFKSRIAFSAAHVVADPLAATDPVSNSQIDWDSTLSYRRHLWSHGFAVAEAMDTAQRGMGLSYEMAKELIKRSAAEARTVNGRIACGAGTDHLTPHPAVKLEDVEAAYEEQCAFVQDQNAQIILMASRALAQCAQGPEDYERIYGNILRQVSSPVILHWLGDMFDPSLSGYWGFKNLDNAMEVCLNVIWDNKDKVDGVKISLLDAEREIEMRRLLPKGIKMYTGDDFNYAELIQGDEKGFSHALLGIFDAIAPAASAALHAMDDGDLARYNSLLEKTVPLSRHIFQKPTFSYKTGIVFMSYLNGHQSHFRMIGGAESARSIVHLSDLFTLADKAGLLSDPEQAAERMKLVLNLAGIRQEGMVSGKL
ncbi:dihydrodipicolinate synthase family protein [Peribacillus deserti]|uniref:Dihydrodipicolinate synthase family protein n=1 Tax=Peribacillus deserti TaxID=673318 RepID=A0A2N5M4U1_9BACI|nr:dihydrodipicolinate synthase family protein [Peribacillus deserti]PLT29391.1 dihydrodipicolinate synthase family protein [Peribacillus deserti]